MVAAYLCSFNPEKSKMGLVTGFYRMWALGKQDVYFLGKGNGFGKLVKNLTSEDVKRPRHLYGPTFVYSHLLDYLEKNNIRPRLDKESRMIVGRRMEGKRRKDIEGGPL